MSISSEVTSVTSAQFDQTCAVASQSQRHPKMYLPGFKSDGIFTTSRTAIVCKWTSPPPMQPSQGGGKEGVPLLSHRLQSLPGVPGHGPQGPPTKAFSHFWQANGVASVSLGPG